MEIYEFSKESVERAIAAHTLGFDVIGRESVPFNNGQHHYVQVYMKNTRERVLLNNEWFPEIPIGKSSAVTYIMHWEDCNRLMRKFIHTPSEIEEENRKFLFELSKKHCVWVRDVYSQDFRFTDCMPWPQANLLGQAFPMFEFIACFNEEFAHTGFDSASKMDPKLVETLLKDYFVEGQEGFNFEVDSKLLSNKEAFNQCVYKLYQKFPHLNQDE